MDKLNQVDISALFTLLGSKLPSGQNGADVLPAESLQDFTDLLSSLQQAIPDADAEGSVLVSDQKLMQLMELSDTDLSANSDENLVTLPDMTAMDTETLNGVLPQNLVQLFSDLRKELGGNANVSEALENGDLKLEVDEEGRFHIRRSKSLDVKNSLQADELNRLTVSEAEVSSDEPVLRPVQGRNNVATPYQARMSSTMAPQPVQSAVETTTVSTTVVNTTASGIDSADPLTAQGVTPILQPVAATREQIPEHSTLANSRGRQTDTASGTERGTALNLNRPELPQQAASRPQLATGMTAPAVRQPSQTVAPAADSQSANNNPEPLLQAKPVLPAEQSESVNRVQTDAQNALATGRMQAAFHAQAEYVHTTIRQNSRQPASVTAPGVVAEVPEEPTTRPSLQVTQTPETLNINTKVQDQPTVVTIPTAGDSNLTSLDALSGARAYRAEMLTGTTNLASPTAATLSPTLTSTTRDSVMTMPTFQLSMEHAGWDRSLGSNIGFMIRENISTANINVKPAELGPINVQISMQSEQLTVNIATTHAHARESVEASIPRLREQFASMGFNDVDVNVGEQRQSGQESGQSGTYSERNLPHRYTLDADGPGAEDNTALLATSGNRVRGLVDTFV